MPKDFRDRLLLDNGGEIEALDDTWQLNPVFDASDPRRAKRTASHIVRETAQARRWSGFPPDAVAIASDGSGNHLVFLSAPGGASLQDAVYVWWHEGGELEQVSDSFSELSGPLE